MLVAHAVHVDAPSAAEKKLMAQGEHVGERAAAYVPAKQVVQTSAVAPVAEEAKPAKHPVHWPEAVKPELAPHVPPGQFVQPVKLTPVVDDPYVPCGQKSHWVAPTSDAIPPPDTNWGVANVPAPHVAHAVCPVVDM